MLRDKLESNFDPSDVDAAMQLSYKALALMRCAHRVIQTSEGGLRMGRDEKRALWVAIVEVAEHLRLIDAPGNATETERFLMELMQ